MKTNLTYKILAISQCILILFQFEISGIDKKEFSWSNSTKNEKIFSSEYDLTNYYFNNDPQQKNIIDKQDIRSNLGSSLSSFISSYAEKISDSLFYTTVFSTVEQENLTSSDLKSPPSNF